MAEELQGLLDRINKEGLEKAESEKDRIISEAKEEAKQIIAKAKKDAEGITAEGKTEAAKLQASGEAGLRQASRDVIVSLESQIKSILNQVVTTAVGQAMTPDTLSEIIKVLAAKYATGAEPSLSVLATEDQVSTLQGAFATALADTFKGGIEIKPVPTIDAGVKVSFDGQTLVHDFSSNAVAEMLCAELNPRILSIITKDADA